ncbi:MAG TPA: hypothetical protein VNZ53_47430 [Steroidobacteraceae bacterium]|nr:hypothetical protein [Steroidobacteraceae bacterium]
MAEVIDKIVASAKAIQESVRIVISFEMAGHSRRPIHESQGDAALVEINRGCSTARAGRVHAE